MSLAPLATCIQFLEQLQLLDAAQLERLRAHDPHSVLDTDTLLRRLVQKKWLTPFQAQAIREGRGRELSVGGYVVVDRLGEGNMGEVFRARRRSGGPEVALKLIRPDRIRNAAANGRFRRELWLAARLAHPNLVTALEVGEADGRNFLAMELLHGADLGRIVGEHGPLPAATACEYARQAALALQYADEHRLVHRDVKPGNLFLTREGTVKLLDLGLARLDDDDGGLTCDGAVVGTPDFMAPEQARDAHSADIRADIYALGCTLYFLLTGRPPFPGGVTVEKLLRHQREVPLPVTSLRPDLSPTFDGLLARAMAKSPAERFRSPAEFADALASTRDAAIVAPPPRRQTPLETLPPTTPGTEDGFPVVEPSSVRPAPAAGVPVVAILAVFLLVALLASAGLWLVLRGSPTIASPTSTSPPLQNELPAPASRPVRPIFVRTGDRTLSVLETLRANRFPTFDDDWHFVGPFDNTDGTGITAVFGPEASARVDLTATYTGRGGEKVAWRDFLNFKVGEIQGLDLLFGETDHACIFLLHRVTVKEAVDIPLLLGADDTLAVRVNGERVLTREKEALCWPGQDKLVAHLKPGENQLLFKVCNTRAKWQFYLEPRFPSSLESALGTQVPADLRWNR